MTSYTVTGHPLNIYQALMTEPTADVELVHGILASNGVGATVNITLTGSGDAKIKGHGALK